MELMKKQIHMNRIKGRASTQITLDDDFIVPDTMDDMAQVLLSTGDILVEAMKPGAERVQISRCCTERRRGGCRPWPARSLLMRQ